MLERVGVDFNYEDELLFLPREATSCEAALTFHLDSGYFRPLSPEPEVPGTPRNPSFAGPATPPRLETGT